MSPTRAGQPRLAGRVAVVTGGGRGIGRAISLAFAAEGAAVVVASRSEEEINAVVAEITSTGGDALAISTDVSDDDAVQAMRTATIERFERVDVVVNNAGIHQPAPFAQYSLEDWQSFVDVNLLGAVRVLRALLPDMAAAGYGKVINIASTAGKYGSLFQSPYNATKHALVGLTRCLALEYAPSGICVNAICPGFVSTDLIDRSMPAWENVYGVDRQQLEQMFLAKVPIGRFLTSEEVAPLAVYLGSAESDGMTGQSLTLAGGLILV